MNRSPNRRRALRRRPRCRYCTVPPIHQDWQPQLAAVFASATVVDGSAACSVGVQQVVTPQQVSAASANRRPQWRVLSTRRDDYPETAQLIAREHHDRQ
jgi:hypothetical protein